MLTTQPPYFRENSGKSVPPRKKLIRNGVRVIIISILIPPLKSIQRQTPNPEY